VTGRRQAKNHLVKPYLIVMNGCREISPTAITNMICGEITGRSALGHTLPRVVDMSFCHYVHIERILFQVYLPAAVCRSKLSLQPERASLSRHASISHVGGVYPFFLYLKVARRTLADPTTVCYTFLRSIFKITTLILKIRADFGTTENVVQCQQKVQGGTECDAISWSSRRGRRRTS
jgi:hypothetical protein